MHYQYLPLQTVNKMIHLKLKDILTTTSGFLISFSFLCVCVCVCECVTENQQKQNIIVIALSVGLRKHKLNALQRGKIPPLQKGDARYDTKLYLIVKFQFGRSRECRILFHCHYSQVNSDLKRRSLLVPLSIGQVDLYENYTY